MPELPEVETLRIGLEEYLKGHTIQGIEVKSQKIFQGNVKDLIGAKVKDVRRFAKVLSIDLSNGNSITVHVKLTGQLIYRGPNLKGKVELSKKVAGGVPGPHTHVTFKLDKGGFLYYNDVRRFGWVRVIKTSEVETSGFIGKLGPEPFGKLTKEKFKEILSKSKTAVKLLMMDQAKIGGVGNIYANDALFLAKIAPTRPSNSLSEKEMAELFDSLIIVLKRGLKYGGASELAFVTADGKEGQYQQHFLAYGQKGKVCPNCKKEKIQKSFLDGRGTFFCPTCQK